MFSLSFNQINSEIDPVRSEEGRLGERFVDCALESEIKKYAEDLLSNISSVEVVERMMVRLMLLPITDKDVSVKIAKKTLCMANLFKETLGPKNDENQLKHDQTMRSNATPDVNELSKPPRRRFAKQVDRYKKIMEMFQLKDSDIPKTIEGKVMTRFDGITLFRDLLE